VTIIKPGQKVTLVGGQAAQVTAASIRSAALSYEVVWWDGKTRCCQWVDPCEIDSAGEVEKQTIGFKAD
jgi:hypothetical protein